MQNIEIELSEEESERWDSLTVEQRSGPTWAFIRALNDRWHKKMREEVSKTLKKESMKRAAACLPDCDKDVKKRILDELDTLPTTAERKQAP